MTTIPRRRLHGPTGEQGSTVSPGRPQGGQCGDALDPADHVNPPKQRPEAGTQGVHCGDTPSQGGAPPGRAKNEHFLSLHVKSKQGKPVAHPKRGQEATAPGDPAATLTQKAPGAPEAQSVETNHHHPPLGDQDALDLAQCGLGISHQVKRMGQEDGVHTVGRDGQRGRLGGRLKPRNAGTGGRRELDATANASLTDTAAEDSGHADLEQVITDHTIELPLHDGTLGRRDLLPQGSRVPILKAR